MKKEILIVDDEATYCFLTQQTIERVGFPSEIKTAENGREALDIIKAATATSSLPAIVFLDINMPIMNGFQFLETFRSEEFPGKENICLVLLSSSDDPEEMERANSLGVKYRFPKPLVKDDFLKLIRSEFNYTA